MSNQSKCSKILSYVGKSGMNGTGSTVIFFYRLPIFIPHETTVKSFPLLFA